MFNYAIEKLPSDKQARIQNLYVDFQKQYGSREDMEAIVLSKRRKALEDELSIDKYQYDLWFDYANLEEQANTIDINKVREIYERAIANQPLI